MIPFQIRPVFEEHGTIIEVVLLKDKRTGVRQGICSVCAFWLSNDCEEQ